MRYWEHSFLFSSRFLLLFAFCSVGQFPRRRKGHNSCPKRKEYASSAGFCGSYSETGVEVWDRLWSVLWNCRCQGCANRERDAEARGKYFFFCSTKQYHRLCGNLWEDDLLGAQQGVRAVRHSLCISLKKRCGHLLFLISLLGNHRHCLFVLLGISFCTDHVNPHFFFSLSLYNFHFFLMFVSKNVGVPETPKEDVIRTYKKIGVISFRKNVGCACSWRGKAEKLLSRQWRVLLHNSNLHYTELRKAVDI